MTARLQNLHRFWPVAVAVAAIGMSWGAAEVRIVSANDSAAKNTKDIAELRREVSETREETNSRLTGIETSQEFTQRDVAEMKRMLERALEQGE